MHRHHIRVLSVALLVLAAAEGMAGLAQGRLGPPRVWPTAALEAKVAQIDALDHSEIVILGSSSAAYGVDPGAMKAAAPNLPGAYNAAMPFGRPNVMSFMFRWLIDPELNPRVAVVELLPHTNLPMTDDGFYEAFLDSAGARSLNGESTAHRIVSRSALYRNRTTLSDPIDVLSRWLRATEPQPTGVSPTGFLTRTDDTYRLDPLYLDSLATTFRSLRESDIPASLEAFASLLDSMLEAGTQPVLLIMPVYEADYFALDPDLRTTWRHYLSSIDEIAVEREVPVLESTDLLWTSDDFSDPAHLNRRGAERLSRWLANEVGRLLDAPEG